MNEAFGWAVVLVVATVTTLVSLATVALAVFVVVKSVCWAAPGIPWCSL